MTATTTAPTTATTARKASATIAVTGAGGFLGGVIARLLARSGHTVHAFARTPLDLGVGIVAHAWDPTRDTAMPASGLAVDAVIDCASVLPQREPDGEVLVEVNRRLCAGALDLAARRRGRAIYMSSQSVYGRPAVAVIGAETPPRPEIPYGEAKLAGEGMLAAAVADGRIAGAAALRLPAVVGRGAHGNFPATAASRILRGETVTLFNPDGLYNAAVGAASVAVFAEHLALGVGGFHAVSLASLPPISVRAAVRAIAEGLGMPLSAEERAAPHGSPTIDPAAAVALGFRPERPDDVLREFGRSARADIAAPRPTR